MVDMTLKCDCCGCAANTENISTFMHIGVINSELPTENDPSHYNRSERYKPIDLCGTCVNHMTKKYEELKGQVK